MAEDFDFLFTNKKTNFINQFVEKNNHSLLVVFLENIPLLKPFFIKV